MVAEGLRPSMVLTRSAFENAIRANVAIGGSTNAVIHLLAIAGRVGVPLELEDFDRLGAEVPLLVNLKPSGEYLMEDFADSGGLPVVMRALVEAGLLHPEALTVTGRTMGEGVAAALLVAAGGGADGRRPGPACGSRYCGAPGQPLPRRRRAKILSRQSRAGLPPGPSSGVRLGRGVPGRCRP